MFTALRSSAQCTAPANLSVSFANNTSAFTWDAVPGASSYALQLKFSYANSWLTLASGLTSNSFTSTGLFQSATFNWRIISYCSTTDSAFSDMQTYTVPCEGPNTPIASNITGTTATVSWTPAPVNTGMVPSFSISYRVLGSTGPWTSAGTTTNTSVTLSGLASNTAYEWCVSRLCSYFNSTPLVGQFTTQYIPCNIPVNLRTLSATYNQATLAWNGVTGGVNYYIQYKKATATNWTTLYAPNTTMTISNLTKETVYDWRVMANCSNAYQSVYSNISQFTTYSNPCAAYGTNGSEWIDFFSLGTISRTSGKEIGGYYKSTQSTSLAKGSSNNTLSISIGYQPGIVMGDYFAVYIDFNRNGTFTDAGEQVVAPVTQMLSSATNYTASFSVPGNAPSGLTKMRVIVRRPTSAIVPCATGFQGEVEDYDVTIVNSQNLLSNIPGRVTEEAVIPVTTASLTVVPNPSNGLFNIELPAGMNAAKYQVTDPRGNLVQQSSKLNGVSRIKLDLSAAAKGLYLLVIYDTAGNKSIARLVLQ